MKSIKLQKSRTTTKKGQHEVYHIGVNIEIVKFLHLEAGDLFEAEPIPGSPDHPEPCILYTRKKA
jgi:hypothetical protein